LIFIWFIIKHLININLSFWNRFQFKLFIRHIFIIFHLKRYEFIIIIKFNILFKIRFFKFSFNINFFRHWSITNIINFIFTNIINFCIFDRRNRISFKLFIHNIKIIYIIIKFIIWMRF
jgi:hypothetical protein